MSLLEFSQTYKPFQYPWAVELSKKHEEVHWIEDEAELSEDVQDWKTKLSVNEKDFITQVLRLFTQSDVQVGENYHELLIPKFRNNEVRNMLSSFAGREAVHQRAYALLNDTLGLTRRRVWQIHGNQGDGLIRSISWRMVTVQLSLVSPLRLLNRYSTKACPCSHHS